MTTTTTVCYWPEPDTGKWIVSLDELDECDRAETTETLDVCDTEEEAADSAAAEGAASGLPVKKND